MGNAVLVVFCAVAGVAWLLIMVSKWQASDADHNGRPLRMILWAIALLSCASSTLTSLGLAAPAQSLSAIGGVGVPGILVAGILGTFRIKGSSTTRAVPIALLIFSAVLAISALLNDQIGIVTWLIAIGLLYLPGLVALVWRTAAPVSVIRKTVMNISLFITWASLAFAVIDLKHAMGDLPRRFQIGDIQYRLAGITPHPNLLSFVTAIALLLTWQLKPRGRILHVLACVAVLLLAESRSLLIGLAVGAACYWIVSARGSRIVRLINTTLVGLPVAVIFWPSIISAFDDSSLGNDVSTLNSRTLVWNLIGTYWTDKPLLGWGPFAFNDRTGSPISSLFFDHAHNQLLEALVEGGLIGLLLMGIVTVRIAWSAARSRDAAYVGLVVVLLFFMMTEVPLTLHDFGFSFTVVLGSLLLALIVPGPMADPGHKPEVTAPAHLRKLESALGRQGRVITAAAGTAEPSS